MPTVAGGTQPHREHIPDVPLPYHLAVARKVKRPEVEKVPVAKAAVDAEWGKAIDDPSS